MFDVFALHWDDIKSEPINGQEFMNTLANAKERQKHLSIYQEYSPDMDILAQIDQRIINAEEQIKILGMGASSSSDCQQYVAQLVKIQENLQSDLSFQMLGELKKNSDGTWAVPPSPPEVLESIFDLTQIPTFYFFRKDGNCFGRIVKRPIMTPTLEEEILSLLLTSLRIELH
jgi:hypothetical protein